ncbi:hypothetical protein Bca101_066722 [Brassica carinata]
MSINPLMTLLGKTFLLLVASSQALKLSLGDPCTVADYPKLCRRTIKGQTNVNAATDMAIKELMNRTMQAKDMAKKEPKGDGGVAVCLSTFGSAFDNLEKALKNIQGNDSISLNINLSAALTDYDTCSDALKETGEVSVSVFYKSADGVMDEVMDMIMVEVVMDEVRVRMVVVITQVRMNMVRVRLHGMRVR